VENVIEKLVVQLVGDLSDFELSAEEAERGIERFNELQKGLKQTIEETTASVVEYSEAQDSQIDILAGARKAMEELTESNKGIAAEVDKVVEAEKALEEQTNSTVGMTEEQIRQQELMESIFGKSRRSMAGLEKTVESYTKTVEEVNEAHEKVKKNEQVWDNLSGGMSRLPGPIGSVSRTISGLVGSVKAFVAASGSLLPIILLIAGALTVTLGPIYAMYQGIKRLVGEFDSLDRVAKRAAAMGESVTDLQSLSHALKEVAGMDASKAEAALQRLQRTVGQAAESGGKAAKAFKDLGLSAQQMASMSPTEQFRAVAKAMENYGSHADRARIAQTIFGQNSKEVVLALTSQAEALREAEEWAQRYGLTITDAQAEAIQSANDSMSKVTDALGGWFTQLAAEFAPLVQVIADYVLEWIPPAGEFKEQIRFVVDLAVVLLGLFIDINKVIIGAARFSMGEFAAGTAMMLDGFEAKTAEEILTKMEAARFEAEKTAATKKAERDAQEAINRELEKQIEAQEKLKKKGDDHLKSLKDTLDFMVQENDPKGEKDRKIWDLEREGVDPAVIEESKMYQEQIDLIKQERREQEEINKTIDERIKKEEAAHQKNRDYLSSLQERFKFMAQEEDPDGEKNNEIWKMEQEGVDPQLIEAARFFDEQIRAIQQKREEAKQAAAEAQREIDRGKALDEQYRSKTDKAIDQAQELQDLLDKGLIKPETFEAGIDALNKGLQEATQEANAFWMAMNGPQMSEFGIGREGLEEDLIGMRSKARENIMVNEQGADPALAKVEARKATEAEGRSRTKETETKLLGVLELLAERLRNQPNPNVLQLAVADDLDTI